MAKKEQKKPDGPSTTKALKATKSDAERVNKMVQKKLKSASKKTNE